MHPAFEGLLNFLGRLLLVGIFLMSGVMKIPNFQATADGMAKKGMVATQIFLAGAIAFEIVGAISVIIGFKARYGAFLLAVFLVPTTLIFHAFWKIDPHNMQEMQNEMGNFMKNFAMFGALLMIIARGTGPWSIDNLFTRHEPPAPV